LGNDYSASGGINYNTGFVTNAVRRALEWNVGDKLLLDEINLDVPTIHTSTPSEYWYSKSYECISTFKLLKPENIVIDGILTDSGWQSGGWLVGSPTAGTYQKLPILNQDLEYKYKLKTDDEYLYIGFSSNLDTYYGNASYLPYIRIWLKTNPEATVYTHYYDVGKDASGNVFVSAKRNTSLTESLPEDIPNSSVEGMWLGEEGMALSRAEMKIKLSEFGGEKEFDYFFCYFSYTQNIPAEYLCLYAHNITIPADGSTRLTNFPYYNWEDAAAGHVVTAQELMSAEDIVSAFEEVL
jgi:hypothetical protein